MGTDEYECNSTAHNHNHQDAENDVNDTTIIHHENHNNNTKTSCDFSLLNNLVAASRQVELDNNNNNDTADSNDTDSTDNITTNKRQSNSNSSKSNLMKEKENWVGAYSPESRKLRIERFIQSRRKRVWTKKVKYDVRKNFADSRLRVKGRFVKKEDEMLMRDLMGLT